MTQTNYDFENKTVLITGASRGIGRATALEFAKYGANIVLDYFVSKYEPDAAENVASLVSEIQLMGGICQPIEADVSSEKQVIDLIEFTKSTYGSINILINNAGIVTDKEFHDRTLQDWESSFAVNLFGQFLCSKYAAEVMKLHGSGRIINIASTNGMNCPYPQSVDYDATKAGVISLTKNLAIEFAPHGILVNAVAPGWVATKMNDQLPPDFITEEASKILLKRFAVPSEIARSILFLASDDASYITGATLVVDGGMKLL